MSEKIKKLYRSRTNKVIFGVCGGLGEYFEMDANIFRLIFILLTITGGAGILLYLVFSIVIPIEPGEPVKSGRQEVKEFVEEVKDKTGEAMQVIRKEPLWTRTFLGFSLIAIGIALLSKQIFPLYFNWLDWDIIWPILILLFGVKLIADNK
jgi:phage shock protein C